MMNSTSPPPCRKRRSWWSPRRLGGIAVLAVTMTAVSACGLTTGSNSGSSGNGPVTLRFSWWGGDARNKATQQVIDAFQAQNPDIKVKGESADFNSYFDRLATETAAGNAPDVITLGGAYPREYGDRGALLDLAKVSEVLNTSDIQPAALGNGKFSGVQYGVPSGVNTFGVIVDPVVFQKAGVALPDDNTWTWDDFTRIAKDVASHSPKGTYGVADPSTPDALDLYSRQQEQGGQGLYSPDGKVAISQQILTDWFTMTTALRDAGAAPPASVTSEVAGQPSPEQSLIGRGLVGMQMGWSNLLGAYRKASGHPLVMLRAPGDSKQAGMWLQASQLYSISSKTAHPKEAAKFVDFLINSVDAGKIIGTDRGIPANAKVLAALTPTLGADDAEQAKFIAKAGPKAGPPLVIGPTGSTDSVGILQRVNADVLFNRATPAKAAQQFIDQLKAAITK